MNMVVSMPDLKGFVDDIIEVCFNDGGIDGYDIQEMAIEYGLLKKVEMSERCCEACRCAEHGDFPQTCYQKAY